MKEVTIRLTVKELNTILESLGNMPYIRVYEMIEHMRFQANEQLEVLAALNGNSGNHENNGAVKVKEEMHAS
ncbi:MAG: hypothetical protein INR73_06620 [Williamsia sp.]|nr:hypothetical protein [Williamsia sp.]